MQLTLIILLSQMFLFFGLLIRFFLFKRKKYLTQLFIDALQNENCEHFEAAIGNYESVLSEVKKRKFYSALKIRITEKIKILHAIIEYKNDVDTIR